MSGLLEPKVAVSRVSPEPIAPEIFFPVVTDGKTLRGTGLGRYRRLAATIDEDMLLEVEASLMKLSDTVTANYFTTRARSDAPWDSLG